MKPRDQHRRARPRSRSRDAVVQAVPVDQRRDAREADAPRRGHIRARLLVRTEEHTSRRRRLLIVSIPERLLLLQIVKTVVVDEWVPLEPQLAAVEVVLRRHRRQEVRIRTNRVHASETTDGNAP